MEALSLVLFLLAAVVVSSIIGRFLPALSLPLVQIALGAVIAAFVTGSFDTGLDAELLLILFIAPLHFNESRHADSGALWKSRWGIFSLAVGLVLVTVVAVGFALHALLPAIPLAAAIAFGAAHGVDRRGCPSRSSPRTSALASATRRFLPARRSSTT